MRALAAIMLAGCTGVTADPGLASELRVAGAQYVEGELPAPATDIAVTGIDSLNNTIWPGQVNKAIGGRLAAGGVAAAVQLAGDPGYWVIPADAPDLNLPDQLTWSARASFSDALAAGAHDVLVAAVDDHGDLGPPSTLTLTAQARDLDLTGTKLAVSLTWDTESDLDLHLVLPDGVVVWSGNLNSYVPPPPGDPVDPDAAAAGGILDVDSNAQCQIDGRREENIAWRGDLAMPPAGAYAVLVDTFSLCAAVTAHWKVDVFVGGSDQPIAHAEGTVTDADTRGAHEAASGVRALTFTY